MYRLTVMGAQIQCETAADVIALVKVVEKTVAVGTSERRVRPRIRKSDTERTAKTELPANQELYNAKSG